MLIGTYKYWISKPSCSLHKTSNALVFSIVALNVQDSLTLCRNDCIITQSYKLQLKHKIYNVFVFSILAPNSQNSHTHGLNISTKVETQAVENNLEVLIIKPLQAHPHNHQVNPKKQIIPPFLQKQEHIASSYHLANFSRYHQFVQVLHSQLTLSLSIFQYC